MKKKKNINIFNPSVPHYKDGFGIWDNVSNLSTERFLWGIKSWGTKFGFCMYCDTNKGNRRIQKKYLCIKHKSDCYSDI